MDGDTITNKPCTTWNVLKTCKQWDKLPYCQDIFHRQHVQDETQENMSIYTTASFPCMANLSCEGKKNRGNSINVSKAGTGECRFPNKPDGRNLGCFNLKFKSTMYVHNMQICLYLIMKPFYNFGNQEPPSFSRLGWAFCFPRVVQLCVSIYRPRTQMTHILEDSTHKIRG